MSWIPKRREDAPMDDERYVPESLRTEPDDLLQKRIARREAAEKEAAEFNEREMAEVMTYEPPVRLKKAADRLFLIVDGQSLPPIPIDAISDISARHIGGPKYVTSLSQSFTVRAVGGYTIFAISMVSGTKFDVLVPWCKADIMLLALQKAMMGEGRIEE